MSAENELYGGRGTIFELRPRNTRLVMSDIRYFGKGSYHFGLVLDVQSLP
jgi:hypothetical protein